MNWDNSGYTLSINGEGAWNLKRRSEEVANGTVATNPYGKYSVKITALEDMLAVSINGKSVAEYQDKVPMLSGRIKLSSTWNRVYFDNLLVKTVKGGIPYALSMVDGQDDSVTYDENWTINQPGGGSADNWYRTLSVSKQAGATFKFKTSGAGFAIVGPNDGTAVLKVTVDGNVVSENAATVAAPTRGEAYILSDLEQKEHDVEITVVSGKLQIDAIHALGVRLPAPEGDVVTDIDTSSLPEIETVGIGGIADLNLPATLEVTKSDGTKENKTVTWTESFDGKEFQQASIIGTVEGAISPLGEQKVVSVPVKMVIPADTYYFIDCAEGNPSTAALSTTEPYETVKKEAGSKLLNEKYDQLKTNDNTWGLVTTTAQTKGYNNDTTDWYQTGIYGNENKAGNAIAYAFTLPAGSYKLISGHREWWNGRSMATTLKIGEGEAAETGNVSISVGSDAVNQIVFTLESEQLVTYTMAATGDNAPAISWLAVVGYEPKEHTHEYIYMTKTNEDGTVDAVNHVKVCKDGDMDGMDEAHTLTYTDSNNGKYHYVRCEECGYAVRHESVYVDNNDGKHSLGCTICEYSKEAEDHTYVYKDKGDGKHSKICRNCGHEETDEAHELTYKQSVSGKAHTESCKICDYSMTVTHKDYVDQGNGKHAIACDGCGYKGEEADHNYGEYVNIGEGKHARTCEQCGAKEEGEHTYGADDICTKCGVKKEDAEQHVHQYTYVDNGDGTHTGTCEADGETVTESHTFKDGKCTLCNAKEPVTPPAHTHEYTYKDNGNGTHTKTCKDNDDTKVEQHIFVDGVCVCGAKETPAHTHTYTYKDNGNGTHTKTCKDNDDTKTENHTYVNGICVCGAKDATVTPPPAHTHEYTYKDNGNGTHTKTCKANDDTKTENHTYVSGVCVCGAKEAVSVTLAKPVISGLANVKKGIKVSWKKVANASGYYVERKDGNSKSWKRVYTAKKGTVVSWTDTKVKSKNGTKYQYRVYAYTGSIQSQVSSAKTTYRLTANKLSSVKAAGKKLQVKWKANKKASGYQIQYSTSKKFAKAKSILVTGGKKTSKTISSGLKKGKKYYVRIRSYKKSGKTKYYSDWSNTKNVKISK